MGGYYCNTENSCIGPEMACSIWEACHHQGTGWTEEIGNYCCYLRLVTALLAGYLKVYLFKLVLVCNPVCRSSMNVELHWLLYMVSMVFRGCILLTIIHTGKTSLKSVTVCCTCHAVLIFMFIVMYQQPFSQCLQVLMTYTFQHLYWCCLQRRLHKLMWYKKQCELICNIRQT